MSEIVELWEQPEAEEIYMIAGWRQWADGGSISSGLPQYLIDQTEARQIGMLRSDEFYLFQIPGTHDLVRPVVRFDEGYPEFLEQRRNELFYAGDEERGVVFFLGDEPHLNIDQYVASLLEAARTLGVRRIVAFGGVYGELPYDKERMVSSVYSLPTLKEEVESLAVNLSDYQGGASIGSYMARRAGEQGMEYVGFYAFVPTYDFTNVPQIGNAIRIENDFMAWLGVMRRVNHMLKINFDLSDLSQKSEQLVEVLDAKVAELDAATPQLNVREYMSRLGDAFDEVHFEPLDEVWEEAFRGLFDESDSAEE